MATAKELGYTTVDFADLFAPYKDPNFGEKALAASKNTAKGILNKKPATVVKETKVSVIITPKTETKVKETVTETKVDNTKVKTESEPEVKETVTATKVENTEVKTESEPKPEVKETVTVAKVENTEAKTESEPEVKVEKVQITTEQAAEPEEYEFKVKVDEGENMELIKPFTFDKAIDENGQVIAEPEEVNTVATANETTEPVASTQSELVGDLSNPYKEALRKEKEVIMDVIKSGVKPTNYYDNSMILALYPTLKNVELAIRELGLDCAFIQRPDKLIAVGIIANGNPMPLSGFMVDLDDVVIGKDPKWFNTFIDQNTDASVLENYFAIRIMNSDLLIKYIKGEATIEEFKRAAIYNTKYIAVNSVVDLRTLPKNLNNNLVDQIVNRLHKGIKAGVFDSVNCTEKFKIKNYTSPASYTLHSGNTTITVERETMKINV